MRGAARRGSTCKSLRRLLGVGIPSCFGRLRHDFRPSLARPRRALGCRRPRHPQRTGATPCPIASDGRRGRRPRNAGTNVSALQERPQCLQDCLRRTRWDGHSERLLPRPVRQQLLALYSGGRGLRRLPVGQPRTARQSGWRTFASLLRCGPGWCEPEGSKLGRTGASKSAHLRADLLSNANELPPPFLQLLQLKPPSGRAQGHGGYVASTRPLRLTTVPPSGVSLTVASLGTSMTQAFGA